MKFTYVNPYIKFLINKKFLFQLKWTNNQKDYFYVNPHSKKKPTTKFMPCV
jgi:hypothetical protein